MSDQTMVMGEWGNEGWHVVLTNGRGSAEVLEEGRLVDWNMTLRNKNYKAAKAAYERLLPDHGGLAAEAGIYPSFDLEKEVANERLP